MTVGTAPDTRCAANFFVQVKLRPGLVSYEAVWYSTFGLGTRWWSSPGTVFPGSITGIGAKYDVPKGYAAWSASYSDCGAPPTGTYGTAAWGVVSKYEISGTVTIDGTSEPAHDIEMQASCGGTTKTDKDGFYSFLVDAGPCTVAPTALPAGDVATPPKRDLDVHSNIPHVDFQVPCDAVPVATSASARAAAGSAAGPCPLKVLIKISGPIPNVGTRSGLAVDDALPDAGPINFTVPASGQYDGQKCRSGCANIVITVIDPLTHKRVPDADVTVSADPVKSTFVYNSSEFFCLYATTTSCGNPLSGLVTDGNGQVHLLYWAPGVINTGRAKLHASAVGCNCSGGGKKHGTAKPVTLTIKHYEIFKHEGELSPREETQLEKVVADPGTFSIGNEVAKEAFTKAFSSALDWLVGAEETAEAAVHVLPELYAEPLFGGLIEGAHIGFELHEQDELLAAFLRAMGTPGIGLLVPDTFETQAPEQPSQAFRDIIIHGLANTLHILTGGELWDNGEGLVHLRGQLGHAFTEPEHIDTVVYEVSTCDAGHPDCGPGYRFKSVGRTGIKPALCFEFTGTYGATTPVWDGHTCIGYDAWAWVETQRALPGMNTALPH